MGKHPTLVAAMPKRIFLRLDEVAAVAGLIETAHRTVKKQIKPDARRLPGDILLGFYFGLRCVALPVRRPLFRPEKINREGNGRCFALLSMTL